MQKWGANLQTNSINLESDLLGLTRKVTRDAEDVNDYRHNAVKSKRVEYPSIAPITEQPRATHPAWTVRDLEQNNMDYLYTDPQKHTNMPFKNNVSTRILEKDFFQRTFDCQPMNDQTYIVPGNVQKTDK